MAGVVLFCFPPFITLLRSRMQVYEEALAYVYLYGVVLAILLASFIARPRFSPWLLLCGAAGLGGFIRPTLVFYGAATMIVAAIYSLVGDGGRAGAADETGLNPAVRLEGAPSPARTRWRLGVSAWLWLLGPALFLSGGGLLFLTNQARFGDGFEFGARLNLEENLSGLMYATKFDHPFQNEPLFSAGRELFGAMFLDSNFNGIGHWYQHGIFPGQSATLRWREMYIKTFDPTHLALALAGWCVGAAAFWKCWFARRNAKGSGGITQWEGELSANDADSADGKAKGSGGGNRLEGWLALWSLLAAIPLAVFYLRTPAITSRYMLDFSPAFAMAIVVTVLFLARLVATWYLSWCLILWIGCWLGWEISQGTSVGGRPESTTWEGLAPWREEATKPRPLISRSAGADLNSKLYDLPFERNGWNTTNGAVMPLISFFVWDPRFLELDLKLKEGVPAISPETVRVKIGLESLERESVRKTADGWLARFRGPKQPRYQNGLQIAFVAFVPKERLADAKTPWRLERVQWDAPGRGKAER